MLYAHMYIINCHVERHVQLHIHTYMPHACTSAILDVQGTAYRAQLQSDAFLSSCPSVILKCELQPFASGALLIKGMTCLSHGTEEWFL